MDKSWVFPLPSVLFYLITLFIARYSPGARGCALNIRHARLIEVYKVAQHGVGAQAVLVSTHLKTIEVPDEPNARGIFIKGNLFARTLRGLDVNSNTFCTVEVFDWMLSDAIRNVKATFNFNTTPTSVCTN